MADIGASAHPAVAAMKTHYTPERGYGTPTEMAEAAGAAGYQAAGICDRGTLAGVLEFNEACVGAGVRCVVGAELPAGFSSGRERDLVWYAVTQQGWKNLLRVAAAPPVSRLSVAAENFEGNAVFVPALPGGWGRTRDRSVSLHMFAASMIDDALVEDIEEAAVSLGRSRAALYVPMRGSESVVESRAEDAASRAGCDLAVLDVGAECPSEEHAEGHKDKLAISEKRRRSPEADDTDPAHVMAVLEADALLSSEAMRRAASNTVRMLHANGERLDLVGNAEGTLYPGNADWVPKEGFAEHVEESARAVWGDTLTEAQQSRLTEEIGTIREMGYEEYFVLMSQICAEARRRGIAVGPGRGSAVGSATAYVLGITDMDPLEHKLSFARFLNEARGDPPDIDIDIDSRRRDELVGWLVGVYGRDRVSVPATWNRFRARNSVQDIARIRGLSQQEGTDLSSSLRASGKTLTLKEMLAGRPPPGEDAARQWRKHREVRESEGDDREIFTAAANLDGRIRNRSRHPSAVMISPSEMPVPVVASPGNGNESVLMCDWESGECERAGMAKLDLLSSKMLAVIDMAVEWSGIAGLSDIPAEDEKAMDFLRRGDTTGVFQMESKTCREMCRTVKPDTFEDIVAILAMDRPGALARQTHEKYARAKTGGTEHLKDLPHKDLQHLLSDTYGLLIYQEQIMEMASHFAGFSPQQADLLRAATSKKKLAEMERTGSEFRAGCEANGFSRSESAALWDWVVPFSSYGFNRSHAAAYAVLSWRSVWLSAHFPAEFFAASAAVAEDKDKEISFLQAASDRGVKLLEPSAASFSALHAPEDSTAIRFGVARIRGMSEAAVSRIAPAGEDLVSAARSVRNAGLTDAQIGALCSAGFFCVFRRFRFAGMADSERSVRVQPCGGNTRSCVVPARHAFGSKRTTP